MRRAFRALLGKVDSCIKVDKVLIVARGGDGGNGACTYLKPTSQKALGCGIPNGGFGGRGGDVVLRTCGKTDLRHIKHIVQGLDGEPGGKKNVNGIKGRTSYIECPPGVVVSEWIGWQNASKNTGKEEKEGLLTFRKDLIEPGDQFVLAHGGAGGRGNSLREPHTQEDGTPGERRRFLLELKSIADVGLIGLPNAGKSSFLRCVSRATPDVAAYPFTTLSVHVGVCRFKDSFEMTVADVPGLIENAHLNEGLGHQFLRHLERTKMLVYVLDCDGKDDVVRTFEILRREVMMYSTLMANRPFAVIANKCDLGKRAIRNCEKLTAHVQWLFAEVMKNNVAMGLTTDVNININDYIYAASTKEGVGIQQAVKGIRKILLQNQM